MLTALEKKHCDTEAKALIDNASAGCRNEENRIEILMRIHRHLNEDEVATRIALVGFANKHQKLFAISQIRENLSTIEREIMGE